MEELTDPRPIPPEPQQPPQFIEGDEPPAPVAPLPAGSRKALRAQQAATRPERERGQARYALLTTFSAIRSLVIVFAVSVMIATIFASFTSNESLSFKTQQNLAIAYSTQAKVDQAPSPVPTSPRIGRIGFIRGHSGIAQRGSTAGNVDPGATCPDDPNFYELAVTTNVGDRVINALRGRGYTVDALDEWDMRLVDPNKPYEAAALLSIHADSCVNFNDGYPHTGFKVVSPEGRLTVRDQDLRLVDCLRDHYTKATGLEHSGWTVTDNMLYYHAFREVSQRTPAAILELGFLYYDRDLLKNHPDKAADGVLNGLLCFLDPKALLVPTPTGQPTAAAATLPPIQPTATVKH